MVIGVVGDVSKPVLLSLWMVETSGVGGERRVSLQSIAVTQDGTRVPAVERQSERFLLAPTTTPALDARQRLDIFSHTIEPTLLRELKHKGTADGDGSYTADLIGYVEVIQPHTS